MLVSLLTLEKRPPPCRCTPSPPACCESAAPFGAPSSDCVQKVGVPRSTDLVGELCVDS